MVERLIPNQHVVGSSPTWPATPASPLSERLDEALRAAGAAPGAAARLQQYAQLLLAANQSVNLTGAKDERTLEEAHLEDALRAAAAVPAGLRVFADWGSGGGLPGLVWAVARPDWFVHCIERIQKKAAFLTAAITALELSNARAHARQLQEVLTSLAPRPDALVARAVEPLGELLGRIESAHQPRVPLLLMAGPRWESDFAALPDARRARWQAEALATYALAPGRGERALVRFMRSGGAQ